LLIIFFSISLFSIAQTKENDKSLLLGEWIWEGASIAEGKRPVTFDLYNDYYTFYSEIEVAENTVVLKEEDEKTLEVKYEVDGNYVGIELPSGKSFIAEWVIIEDKLYLEFSVSGLDNTSKKENLLVVYKRK
jgi:hypothetical protein